MNEIGNLLKSTREKNGVSIEEASEDLDIKVVILENVENGNIGGFKDIFILKDYIRKYAKYLGLEPEKVIDVFNEYLFEYTSRIPIKAIEKAVQKKESNKQTETEVKSPYTKVKSIHKTKKYIIIYVAVAVVVLLLVVWSLSQLIVG